MFNTAEKIAPSVVSVKLISIQERNTLVDKAATIK